MLGVIWVQQCSSAMLFMQDLRQQVMDQPLDSMLKLLRGLSMLTMHRSRLNSHQPVSLHWASLFIDMVDGTSAPQRHRAHHILEEYKMFTLVVPVELLVCLPEQQLRLKWPPYKFQPLSLAPQPGFQLLHPRACHAPSVACLHEGLLGQQQQQERMQRQQHDLRVQEQGAAPSELASASASRHTGWMVRIARLGCAISRRDVRRFFRDFDIDDNSIR